MSSLSSLSDKDLLELNNLYKSKEIPTNTSRLDGLLHSSYDVKFGSHCVRLCLEAEQIARECELDPMRNRETLKALRRGEWTLERLEKWLENKLVSLETDYSNSNLPERPDENKIKELLLNCLEMKFGNLERVEKRNEKLLDELKALVKKYQ